MKSGRLVKIKNQFIKGLKEQNWGGRIKMGRDGVDQKARHVSKMNRTDKDGGWQRVMTEMKRQTEHKVSKGNS